MSDPATPNHEVSHEQGANSNSAPTKTSLRAASLLKQIKEHNVDPNIGVNPLSLLSYVIFEKELKGGIVGFVKIRGSFKTDRKAQEMTKYLFERDSDNPILTIDTGKWYPLTRGDQAGLALVPEEMVDPNNNSTSDESREEIEKTLKMIKGKQSEKEKEDIEDIKRRKEAILKEQREPLFEATLDNYTTEVNKLEYLEVYLTKLEKQKTVALESIERTKKIIADWDATFPSFKHEYKAKIVEARRKIGLPDEPDQTVDAE
jgi:hypothetical protein